MSEQPPPPQWAPPPQQPQWGTPPPGQWGQPGYSAPPQRPTGVTLGSIWLIVIGILEALFGAGCGLLGAGASAIPDEGSGLGNLIGGSLLIFGIIFLVLGILQILAGAGALGGKSWGRWIGIILSILFVIGGAFGLLGALGALNQAGGVTSLAFLLVWTLAYGFTAYAFISAGAFFSARR